MGGVGGGRGSVSVTWKQGVIHLVEVEVEVEVGSELFRVCWVGAAIVRLLVTCYPR